MFKEVKLVNSELDGLYEIIGLDDGRSFGFINPTVFENLDTHFVNVNVMVSSDSHFIDDPLEVVTVNADYSKFGICPIKK